MSGIAGIIRFDGAPVEVGMVEKMTAAMPYRGPDGIHHWVKGSVAMGQCMLNTTPESLEETQPLTNEDKSLVLVMDGRVDNWEELRKELLGQGTVLRNRSDAELVLRSYETWKEACLTHIDGDFALVIWDAQRQTAFCARDRLGNKPFNYHWNGRIFVFASELHAILSMPWVPQVLNEEMFAEYMAFEFYARDETLWQGILRLVAAHSMIVGQQQGPQPKQYWEPDYGATLSYRKDDEYIDHYRDLIIDTVRRHSRSYQPVSFEVSGGLDSSAIFCIAEHLRRTGLLLAPAIEGYTLAFNDNSDANELSYARAVGKYLGVKVHEIPPSRMPLSWYADQASTYLDFPGYPNGVMHLSIRKRASLEGSHVTLNGIGGDEWLQGSRGYYAEELEQRHWHTFFDCFRIDAQIFGNMQAMMWVSRYGIFPLLPNFCKEALRLLLKGKYGSDVRDTYWLSPRIQEKLEIRRRHIQKSCSTRPHQSVGQRGLSKMLNFPFNDLATEDAERQGARSSIEIRSPFRSQSIVQYAFSTPERLRLRGNRSKYIHVKALQDIMPKEIVERKSKAEFSVVFQEQLDQMSEVFTKTLPREHAHWLMPEGIAQLFKKYERNRFGISQSILWNIYGCYCISKKLDKF